MLRIVCVQAGNYCERGAQYVNTLHDMVLRNLPAGYPGTFECFTDDATGLSPGITPRSLPSGLKGWYNKLWLFSKGLFPENDRIVYFDLDTLIAGRLDEIVSYDGEFAIMADLMNPLGANGTQWQSAVMAWRSGFGNTVWQAFVEAGFPSVPGGDQQWIQAHCPKADLWQALYHGKFISYKMSGGRIPSKASVVCFHGHPRIHEVTEGWVPQVWKLGGITRSELDTICNTASKQLVDNLRYVLKQDKLPWLDLSPAHERHCVIVAGGPSINDKKADIAWRKSIGQEIWAVNGTADWLRKELDIIPEYHVIADARPDNACFVQDTQTFKTKYLIASQCSPALFRELWCNDVTVWHPNLADYVSILETVKDKPVHLFGGGSTVGLNAITLAYGMGYRTFHLYGFDSSYSDNEQHHAYRQDLNDKDLVIDALCGNRMFKAAPWMVQQANEFEALIPAMLRDGCTFTVAGDGLIPTLARDIMAYPRLCAHDVRASEVIKRVSDVEQPVGAEIGVFCGAMSASLLDNHPGLHLYMVDSWEGGDAAYSDPDDWHAHLSQREQDDFARSAESATQFADQRRTILRQRSVEAAEKLNGTKLDFVFIDADHSYAGCKADIEAWAPKVKPGGWLCGHDYANAEYPQWGVQRAVDEYAAAHGLTVECGENYTWFTRIPQAAPPRYRPLSQGDST